MMQPQLVIAADQALVAEAVRVAMSSAGFDTRVTPWGGSAADPGGSADPSELVEPEPAWLGLIMSDLESLSRLRTGRDMVRRSGGNWVLLTAAPKGPTWGAMLESGVRVILPSSTTLVGTVEALAHLATGDDLGSDDEREQLIAQWLTERADRERLHERVDSLTPRERTVLRLLHAGDKVRTISGLLGISEATVRSHVRAMLRKLDVNSQLAAVAAYGWLQGEQPRRP